MRRGRARRRGPGGSSTSSWTGCGRLPSGRGGERLRRHAGRAVPPSAGRRTGVPGHADVQPAFVIDPCFDVLARNRAQEVVLGPGIRALLPEWEAEAEWRAGLLRQQAAYELDNPRCRELIDELTTTSPHFARLWEAHEVVEFRSSVRRYRHPRAGDIEVPFVRLAVREAPWLSLICHFPEPGSESARRVRGLVTLPE
ncbi:hypothetical protein [Streptomyces sp. NPDC101776]|uniref:MmyB family transcriptional regulator n=1 Tax=Streptomyces sp. NPDC101776 TaxID=3366146 RepID=UPI0038223F88